jgi:dipeptidyl aminopeptidase/acylaminoacyl peptidase
MLTLNLLGSNTTRTLLNDWDRSIQAVTWSIDGQSLFFGLGEEARNVIYKLSNILSLTSVPIRLVNTGSSYNVNTHPTNNETFVFMHGSISEPTNIYLYTSPTSMRALTDHNKNLLDKVRMSTVVETFNFTGARNETVWGWHVQPVNGTAQKAPLAFLIHGGPQSSWYDAWSNQWNFQTFSSQGYAVIAINFHGSDSYGQNFTDSITGQYGTLPFEDLQLGLTEALRLYPYIDGNRAAALGASYGGFMINWIAGHPEMSQRFKTLVCHDGLFDMRGMGYSTEELWFSEHDAGGFTPYDNPEAFEEFNPVNYVANWTQPMLIIHGGRDYRVPDTQGIGAFTALQRRGIESRLLYLPNENHWTLNPFNSLIWYKEVLDWINRKTQ